MEIQIRPTVATDLPRLMAMDHTTTSDYVWQLELRREVNQIAATFREVRLPRSISLVYPHDQYALSDEWTRKSMMFTALNQTDPVGYVSLVERKGAYVVWVTDLVVANDARRQGVASLLLNTSQEWAVSRSARRIILEMQSKNQACVHLAQKYGYEFCGYNDQYYATQDIALFFSKNLK
jgi:GNAT superfamily N-acetyltransferase